MMIQIVGIAVSGRRLRAEPAFGIVDEYVRRAAYYEPCSFRTFPQEADLLAMVERRSGRPTPFLIVLDGGGKLLSSKQLAEQLGHLRDGGRQELIAAIGPADGWSAATRERADLILSLGPMTLPHALALAVLAEQIYRALTILAGHPYHCGH